MAITYVSSASASATSVSLPSFTPGDVALVVAYGASAVPSGWSSYPGLTSLGWRVLQSGDTTTGTWTSASQVGVIVYSGVNQNYPVDIGSYPIISSPSSSTVSFEATPTALNPSSLNVQLLITNPADSNTKGLSTTGWTNRTSGLSVSNFGAQDSGSTSSDYTLSAARAYYSFTIGLLPESGFPVIADLDTTTGTVTSNSTSWTLTYPSNIAAGDLLLCLIAGDGNGYGLTAGSPFPARWYAPGTGGANALTILKRTANGTESGTFSQPIEANEQGSWVIYRIPGSTIYSTAWPSDGNFTSQQDSDAAAIYGAYSSSATPNPPALNPANWDAENTLWLAVVGVDTSRTVSDHSLWDSEGFFAYADYVSGGSNGATLAVARRETTDQSLVNPSTITISSSDDWVAATIAIRPAAAPPAATSLPPIPARFHLIRR